VNQDYTPKDISVLYAALASLRMSLPDHIHAGAWKSMQPRYEQLIAILEASRDHQERQKALDSLLDLVRPHEMAFSRLGALYQKVQALWDGLDVVMHDPSAAHEELSTAREAVGDISPLGFSAPARLVLASPQWGVSIKPGNFDFRPVPMSGIVLSVLGFATDLGSTPILSVLSGLSFLKDLIDAVSIELSEREASVFLGLGQAVSALGRPVRIDEVACHVALVRDEAGLARLSDTDIEQALQRLVDVCSVELVASSYSVSEAHIHTSL